MVNNLSANVGDICDKRCEFNPWVGHRPWGHKDSDTAE